MDAVGWLLVSVFALCFAGALGGLIVPERGNPPQIGILKLSYLKFLVLLPFVRIPYKVVHFGWRSQLALINNLPIVNGPR